MYVMEEGVKFDSALDRYRELCGVGFCVSKQVLNFTCDGLIQNHANLEVKSEQILSIQRDLTLHTL